MRLLLIKLYNSFRSNGFFLMLYHCLRYPIIRLKTTVIRRKIFSANDENEIFKKIYEMNWWGSNESISGHGSTLNYTENLRKELPIIFDKFSIHKVFDAPCGDFNWMIKVIKKNNIKYLGADIVESLIKHNNTLFSNDRIKFIHLNILKDEFPEADPANKRAVCKKLRATVNDLNGLYQNAKYLQNKRFLTIIEREKEMISNEANNYRPVATENRLPFESL